MSKDGKVPQVQVQVMGEDGEWYTPQQVPAILAAIEAAGKDMNEYSGSYGGEGLRKIRDALRHLDRQITQRIGA